MAFSPPEVTELGIIAGEGWVLNSSEPPCLGFVHCPGAVGDSTARFYPPPTCTAESGVIVALNTPAMLAQVDLAEPFTVNCRHDLTAGHSPAPVRLR